MDVLGDWNTWRQKLVNFEDYISNNQTGNITHECSKVGSENKVLAAFVSGGNTVFDLRVGIFFVCLQMTKSWEGRKAAFSSDFSCSEESQEVA